MENNCNQCFNAHYQPHCHPTTKSLWLCSSVHYGPPHQSRGIWLSAEADNQKGWIDGSRDIHVIQSKQEQSETKTSAKGFASENASVWWMPAKVWVVKFNGLSTGNWHWGPYNPYNLVIITYTLESSSSLTQITHNLQVTINIRRNKQKKKHKTWGYPLNWLVIKETATLQQFTFHTNCLTSTLTDTEPYTAITNQPEENKENI